MMMVTTLTTLLFKGNMHKIWLWLPEHEQDCFSYQSLKQVSIQTLKRTKRTLPYSFSILKLHCLNNKLSFDVIAQNVQTS